jgi:hypothetical protein
MLNFAINPVIDKYPDFLPYQLLLNVISFSFLLLADSDCFYVFDCYFF